MTADDRVASTLAGIRADLTDGAVYPHRVMEIHAPRLLAAVEAALKLTDEYSGGPYANDLIDRWHAGNAFREAITASLTGTQPSEDEGP